MKRYIIKKRTNESSMNEGSINAKKRNEKKKMLSLNETDRNCC